MARIFDRAVVMVKRQLGISRRKFMRYGAFGIFVPTAYAHGQLATVPNRRKAFSSPVLDPNYPTTLPNLGSWWKADSLALSDGDPVSTWNDSNLSNNLTGSGGTRPLYKTNIFGTRPVVRFDGVDDVLDMASDLVLNVTTKFTVFIVFAMSTGYAATANMLFGYSDSNQLTFSGSPTIGVAIHDSGSGLDFGPGQMSIQPIKPKAIVLKKTATTLVLRENNLAAGSCSSTSLTNLEFNKIGKYVTATLYLKADLAEVIVYNDEKTDAECDTMFTSYLNLKYPVVSDTDLAFWVKRVQAAGSDVTGSGVQSAVGTFIDGLKTDGLWNLAYYMEVYAADSLAGLAAPLVMSNFATPVIVGFVGGDYTTNGLIGGAGKRITTNFLFTTPNSLSMGVYARTDAIAGGAFLMGGGTSPTNPFWYLIPNLTGPTIISVMQDGTKQIIASIASTKGFFMGSRVSSTDHRCFYNGSQAGSTNTSAPTAGTTPWPCWIHSLNYGGSELAPSAQQVCFSWIGTGLTPTQEGNLYTRIQTLQTALGRQV